MAMPAAAMVPPASLGPSPSPQPFVASWEGTPPPGTIGADEPTFRAPPKVDRSRPLGVWLVAVAALLLAGVIGAVFFGRGAAPAPAPGLAASAPPSGTVVVVPTGGGVPSGGVPSGGVPSGGVPSGGVPSGVGVSPVAAALPSPAGSIPAPDGPSPSPLPEPTSAAEPAASSPASGANRLGRPPREEAAAPPEAPAPPPASSGEGYLVLVTSPWTNVTCNGRSLGTTPIMRASLAPGHYTCRLTNPDDGVAESYEFDIRPAETTRVRLGLR
jgi:hypothetical protein